MKTNKVRETKKNITIGEEERELQRTYNGTRRQ